MKYIMLVYMNQEAFSALPKEEQTRIHQECGTWHDELVATGRSTGAIGLHPPATATSLRQQNGRIVVSDGPFAETKEVLGGLERLECKDLDEALAIAKRFPTLRAGCTVEIRPEVSGPGECEAWDAARPNG
ncbi:MAG TPA: YciI family protein [Verrucomicrobiales bacterium]|jgi:hypothetical protein|nr:YciI family protein [Verrucomicrobiales bacterium]